MKAQNICIHKSKYAPCLVHFSPDEVICGLKSSWEHLTYETPDIYSDDPIKFVI